MLHSWFTVLLFSDTCLTFRFPLYLQQESLFNLRRPYDLVALLKQEQRAIMLENLKEELLARKEEIDRNEDKDTGNKHPIGAPYPQALDGGRGLLKVE